MWILPSGLTAARVARRRVESACAGMPQEKVEVARLLVTELVTNALTHGSGTVELCVVRGRGVKVDVALADSWGVSPRGDGQPGKRVWFTLD